MGAGVGEFRAPLVVEGRLSKDGLRVVPYVFRAYSISCPCAPACASALTGRAVSGVDRWRRLNDWN